MSTVTVLPIGEPKQKTRIAVRRVTENGFTAGEEAAMLAAAKASESLPFRPAADVIAELRRIADEA